MTRRAPSNRRPALRLAGTLSCLGLAGPLLLAALSWAPVAGARESDRGQPANVEADRVEIDRQAGVSRYYGDVVFTQGTLRLTGDTVTLRAPGGVVRHATAVGKPATVRQESDAGDRVRAHAHVIEYDAAGDRVTLTGEAELLREGERFAAGHIVYRPSTGRVEATRGSNGERVRIRIEPSGPGESGGTGSSQ